MIWFTLLFSFIFHSKGVREWDSPGLGAGPLNIYVYDAKPGQLRTVPNGTECEAQINDEIRNTDWEDDAGATQIYCKNNEGKQLIINLVYRREQARENSISSQYLMLQTNQIEDTIARAVTVSCWVEGHWVDKIGHVTSDLRMVCCTNGTVHPAHMCSTLLLTDDRVVIVEERDTITTGYGFPINYSVNLWPDPIEKLQISLKCGKDYQCEFKGAKKESGDCRLSWRPGDKLPSLASHNLSLIIPFLTPSLEHVTLCSVEFSVLNVLTPFFNSTIRLNFTESPVVVSPLSNVSLVDRHKSEDNYNYYKIEPLCAGDGYPPPVVAQWEYVNKSENASFDLDKWNDKHWRYVFRKKKAPDLAGILFECRVITAGGSTVAKKMMFVNYDYNDDYGVSYSHERKLYIDKGEKLKFACKTDTNLWDPKPSQYGWTYNGGNHISSVVDVDEGSEYAIWTFVIDTSGQYGCWAAISINWTNPDQSATFRKQQSIKVDLNYKPTQPKINIESVDAQAADTHDSVNYSYLIGLGVFGLIVIISTVISWKVVRKNQAKVSHLDTKISLDKVQTKMGFNALYSQVSQTDALIAAVNHIPKDDLDIHTVIGTGQFGKVLKATLTCHDEEGSTFEVDVAVKSLVSPDPAESYDEFFKEVCMMHQFDHPNVIKLIGICTEYDQCMIILEYMEQGNLKDYLMSKVSELTLKDKLYISYQIACGLDHIASKNVVHRDIAARNCLVGSNLNVKVADFGLSRNLSMEDYYRKLGGQIPIRWMSPESLIYGKYTIESDVWAFGVLMWEVYTEGHFPYSGYSNEEVQTMIKDGFKLHVPPHCTEDISVIMQATWDTDAASRPSFRELKTRLGHLLRNSEIVPSPDNATTSFSLYSNYSSRPVTADPTVPAVNRYTTEPLCCGSVIDMETTI